MLREDVGPRRDLNNETGSLHSYLHLLQIPGVISSNMPYFSESIQPHVENCNLFDIAGHLNVTMNRMDGVSNDTIIAQQGGSTPISFYIAVSHPNSKGSPPSLTILPWPPFTTLKHDFPHLNAR